MAQHADTETQGSERQLQRERRAIERAQGGDLAALEPILAHHTEALFALLLGRLGDRATAEDLLKDTLVVALERIGAFTWQQRSIYHWLRQIALHKVIDHHRAAGRRRRLVDALRAELGTKDEAAPQQALDAEEERRLSRRRIDEALAILHPRYAQVLRLRLCDERPRPECAAELGVTVEHFDVLLFRAVRAFRKVYGEPDVP